MSTQATRHTLIAFATIAGLCFSLPAFAQYDAEAAETMFKENDCHKCHHATKSKKGPPLSKTAAKYKGKADAEAKLIEHMSKGGKVKLEDGTEEDHKVLDTKDPEVIRNVAHWILDR